MSKPCEKVIDEELDLVCGEPARDTVVIRGHAGSVRVWVCPKHKAEHNERAANLRAARAKR